MCKEQEYLMCQEWNLGMRLHGIGLECRNETTQPYPSTDLRSNCSKIRLGLMFTVTLVAVSR